MNTKDNVKSAMLRCDDYEETLVLDKHGWADGKVYYEICIQDSYLGGDYCGLCGRLKRAWRALTGKPVYYSSVFVEDETRVCDFIKDCLKIVEST